ncbi:MAG: type II secretion system F family protein [Actinomycetota bacterium]
MRSLALLGAVLIGAGVAVVGLALVSRRSGRRLPEGLGHRAEAAVETRFGLLGRAAEKAVASTSLGRRLGAELPRVGLRLSPGEFVAGAAGVAIFAGVLAGLLFRSTAVGLVTTAIAPPAARILLRRRANRWVDRFENELPDALDLLAGSLEAGASLAQAMELLAAEGQPPVATEFDRVMADNRLGESLVDALEASAARTGSRDYAWCVRAIRIQQDFGASLSDLLRTLADFVRFRHELKREVRTLTAEGRISAYILIALPFVVATFFSIVNPSYLALLVSTPLGWILTVTAGVLMAIGTIWMTRITKVEA